MNSALELIDVSYSYRSAWSNKLYPVLQNISLIITQGEAFGFLGANGAGKTTTIKCILDLNKPRSGQIKIFGQYSTDAEARRFIGYLPEHPYWYDHLTVEESMQFYAQLYDLPSESIEAIITQTLDRVGILSRKHSVVRTLSKGLTQRLGLATTIMHSPKLLLLDEPFSGLDPVGRKEFRDILLEQKQSGATIFMSSHILDDVSQICDRASILKNGSLAKIVEIASRQSSSSQIQHYEVSFVDNGMTAIKIFNSYEDAIEALQKLTHDKKQILSFTPSLKSLEQLFIETVQP